MNATPALLDALLVLLLLWPAACYGRVLFRRGVRLGATLEASSAPGLIVLSVVFLSTNVILLSARSYPALSWYLPVLIEYWGVPALWLANLASITFVFVAVFVLACLSRSRMRWVVPVACVAVLFAAEHLFRSSTLVCPPEIGLPRMSKDGVIMQSSGSSCAAVACANIAMLYGMPKSEVEMVNLLGTTVAGTSPAQVVHGMQSLGYKCTKRLIPDRDITRVHPPAVVFVSLMGETDSHAVAFVAVKDGLAEIWDSSFGRVMYAPSEFAKTWGGRAIEVARQTALGIG